MATEYPEDFDDFTVPSLPESTSLSSAGGTTRNHVQHHRDLGDAVEALQVHAAIKGHDHDGSDDRLHGPKLAQINTHEDDDTDSAPEALHHTIGSGANQAAPGNHIHDYNGPTIINQPFILCTSGTRPGSPYPGLMIYETDTNRMRVWASFGGAPARWALLPVANIPAVRLYQNKRQKVFPVGTSVEWGATGAEDNFGFWDAASPTVVTIKEPGLYKITAALQWDPSWVPDIAIVVLTINGEPTAVRTQQFLRGNTYTPGFSQTLEVSGQLRFGLNDALGVQVKHVAGSTLLDKIFLYFDPVSNIKSRIDIQYLQP